MNLSDIVVYVILIIFLVFAIKSEKLDLFCPKDKKKYDCEACGDGKGKYYIDGKYEEDDDVDKILLKIEWLSEYNEKTVKWRRVYILSFFSVVLYSLLTGTLSSGKKALLLFLSMFIIFYSSFSYYYFHFEKFPEHYIKNNIYHLRKKLELPLDSEPKFVY